MVTKDGVKEIDDLFQVETEKIKKYQTLIK